MPANELLDKCKNLETRLTYQDNKDFDALELADEIKQLCHLLKNNTSPIQVLKFVFQNEFAPNVAVAMRILLCLPVTVASGEPSFSKLKLIKTYLRSTTAQSRLADLATISIEHELAQNLDYKELVQEFAAVKVRKVQL